MMLPEAAIVPTRPSPTPMRVRCTDSRARPSVAKELEHVAGAERIDRADLGDQVGRDQLDDAVEPRLPVDRQRHHLDHAPKQLAGAGELDVRRSAAVVSPPRRAAGIVSHRRPWAGGEAAGRAPPRPLRSARP
jgi:hypothetical protein